MLVLFLAISGIICVRIGLKLSDPEMWKRLQYVETHAWLFTKLALKGIKFQVMLTSALSSPSKCWMCFLFSPINAALMDQAQAVLYMNHMGRWEKRRGMRWNWGTKRLSPIIFLTARHTPHGGVKQARWVQDQCKSKCYSSSLTARLHPGVLLCWWATPHRGPTRTSEDHLMLFILCNRCSPVRCRENTLTPTGT